MPAHDHHTLSQFHQDRLTALFWKRRLALAIALGFGVTGLILTLSSLIAIAQGTYEVWPAYTGGNTMIVLGVVGGQLYGAYDAHTASARGQQEHNREITELREAVEGLRRSLETRANGALRELISVGDQFEAQLRRRDQPGDDTGPHRQRHS